jgi:hypothetical protein
VVPLPGMVEIRVEFRAWSQHFQAGCRSPWRQYPGRQPDRRKRARAGRANDCPAARSDLIYVPQCPAM